MITVGQTRVVTKCPAWLTADPIPAGSRLAVIAIEPLHDRLGDLITFSVNGGGYRTMSRFYVRNYSEVVK